MLETWFWWQNQWDMGNHLGAFSEAQDQPEGQELGRGAIGGQEGLPKVKF